MKPKVKKIIIIALAIAIIAAVVWYVFSWKKSPEGIISRLDFSKMDMGAETDVNMRKRIRGQVGAVKQSFTREQISQQAEKDGLTYNQELVDWACYLLLQMGYLNQPAYDDLSLQIKTL